MTWFFFVTLVCCCCLCWMSHSGCENKNFLYDYRRRWYDNNKMTTWNCTHTHTYTRHARHKNIVVFEIRFFFAAFACVCVVYRLIVVWPYDIITVNISYFHSKKKYRKHGPRFFFFFFLCFSVQCSVIGHFFSCCLLSS